MSHVTFLPEIRVPGAGRLGRHIDRGTKFSAHLTEKTGEQIVDTTWTRECPPFDQGDLGSCTGNAAAGCLMTTPLYVTGRAFTEATAVAIYSEATHFSSPDTEYPPNDEGSSGPASAQALEAMGLVSAYTHSVDLQGALEGLMAGPGSFGVSWMSSFDTPLPTGECPLSQGAIVRGGHEIQAWKVDTENERVWFYQSWGPTWGGLDNGTFWLSYATLTELFDQQADSTFFTGTQQVNPSTPV
jgi:hypothetical protein